MPIPNEPVNLAALATEMLELAASPLDFAWGRKRLKS
jgi:hypothetical protein